MIILMTCFHERLPLTGDHNDDIFETISLVALSIITICLGMTRYDGVYWDVDFLSVLSSIILLLTRV
jgi:hypothetical protein